ncbi:hypothetical protein C0J52_20897 [Blattella germanica]|nr:hypothetical protein C0J52_20897 [Blattella germanica]
MSLTYEVIRTLSFFYLIIAVHGSYTNSSYNTPPPVDPTFPPPKTVKKASENKGKSGRIFNFSDKDNEINVELGFTIPFITIPIKGQNSDEKKPLVNVNVGAITAGTILTTAALLFIPKAFSGLEPQISFGRSESGDKTGFLSRMDKALMAYNIDSSACTQRAVCWLVKSAASKVTSGVGGSTDKIIDGISSNFLLEKFLQGTAIQEAIQNGRQDRDCSSIYFQCPITQEALMRFAHKFMHGIINKE